MISQTILRRAGGVVMFIIPPRNIFSKHFQLKIRHQNYQGFFGHNRHERFNPLAAGG